MITAGELLLENLQQEAGIVFGLSSVTFVIEGPLIIQG